MSILGKLFGPPLPRREAASADEIPEIISQLQQSAQNGNFAVLMFVPAGSKDGEAVNLQYSIDNGVVGFDWVLISPRNVADKMKVMELASTLGYQLEEREMNGVRFLRMIGAGISEFGARVIQDIYKIERNTKLEITTQGFKWQPPGTPPGQNRGFTPPSEWRPYGN